MKSHNKVCNERKGVNISTRTKKEKEIPESQRWYKDPTHIMFLSPTAHEHRLKLKQTAERSKQTKQKGLQAQLHLHSLLGKEHAENLVNKQLKLFSSLDFGKNIPTRLNTHQKISAHKTKKLSRPDLYRHHAGYTKLYVTGRIMRTHEYAYIAVAADFDNVNKQKNDTCPYAREACLRLQKLLAAHGIVSFAQPSTSNGGYHLWLFLQFDKNLTDLQIREQLTHLRANIRNMFAEDLQSGNIAEAELKGLPLVWAPDRPCGLLGGVLIRAPLLNSLSLYEAYMRFLSNPSSFSGILAATAETLPSQSKQEDLQEVEPGDCAVLCTDSGLYSSAFCVFEQPEGGTTERSKIKPNLEQHINGTANQRMGHAYGLHLQRYGCSPESPEAGVQFYESLNLQTGPATPERLKRSQFWHNYFADITPTNKRNEYTKLLKTIIPYAKLITTNSERFKYEHVAYVMDYINRSIIHNKPQIFYNIFIERSKEDYEAGRITFKLTQKSLAACVRLLVEYQIIEHTQASEGSSRVFSRGTKFPEQELKNGK